MFSFSIYSSVNWNNERIIFSLSLSNKPSSTYKSKNSDKTFFCLFICLLSNIRTLDLQRTIVFFSLQTLVDPLFFPWMYNMMLRYPKQNHVFHFSSFLFVILYFFIFYSSKKKRKETSVWWRRDRDDRIDRFNFYEHDFRWIDMFLFERIGLRLIRIHLNVFVMWILRKIISQQWWKMTKKASWGWLSISEIQQR